MKTILAGTGAVGIALGLWAAFLSPWAQSQSAPQVSLTQSTWYWQGEATPPGGLTLPQAVPDPTVPAGDLAVGGPEQQGQALAETYLEFDVSSIPADSTVSSFKISLPVDASAQSLVPAGTVPPIIACTPQQPWPAAPGPQPFGQKPADHCNTSAPKVTSSDGGKTYTVEVASIASGWVASGAQNFGVAITDDPSNTSTAYQVVFGPSSAIANIHATIDYSPPANLGGNSTGGETPAIVNSPSLATGTAAPSVPGFAVLPVTGTEGIPPATAPIPTTAPTTPTHIKSAAAAHSDATSAPPAGFWIVAVLLAALMGVCMLELRRRPELSVATNDRGVGRLLSSLAARQQSDRNTGGQQP